MADSRSRRNRPSDTDRDDQALTDIKTNTIRCDWQLLLMISATVVIAGNRDRLRYSVQDNLTPGSFAFLKYLELQWMHLRPWAV
jgi:hypothetical protein